MRKSLKRRKKLVRKSKVMDNNKLLYVGNVPTSIKRGLTARQLEYLDNMFLCVDTMNIKFQITKTISGTTSKKRIRFLDLTYDNSEMRTLEEWCVPDKKPKNVAEYRKLMRTLNFNGIDNITDTTIKIRFKWLTMEELYKQQDILQKESVDDQQVNLIKECEIHRKNRLKNLDIHILCVEKFTSDVLAFWNNIKTWTLHKEIIDSIVKYKLLESQEGVTKMLFMVYQRIKKSNVNDVETSTLRLLRSVYLLSMILYKIYKFKIMLSFFRNNEIKDKEKEEELRSHIKSIIYVKKKERVVIKFKRSFDLSPYIRNNRKKQKRCIYRDGIIVAFNRWSLEMYGRDVINEKIEMSINEVMEDFKLNLQTSNLDGVMDFDVNNGKRTKIRSLLLNNLRFFEKVSDKTIVFDKFMSPKPDMDDNYYEFVTKIQ